VPPAYVKRSLTDIISVEKIVTFYYYELDADFSSNGDCHDFWELVYADGGDLVATGGDSLFYLKAGECLLHKPDEYHHLKTDGVHGANVLIITFVSRSKAMEFFDGKKFLVSQTLKPLLRAVVDEATKTFELPMEAVLCLRKNAPVGGKQIIRNYLELFLIHLMRSEGVGGEEHSFLTEETSENRLVNTIMERLRDFEHYYTVDEICRDLNYSRGYLSRIFKEHCHMTMGDYRMKMRVQKAKLLLREKGSTAAQVADQLHFTDSKHFLHAFKKVTGMTPREYLRSVKS